jgi:hypothetical protein
MANTISNFLVGVGFDFDKDSAKKVESSLDGVKSKALQLGAVLAGAFGARALTAGFAATNDRLGKFSEVMGVSANDVAALGRALEHEGGSLESFMGQLQGLERMRAGLLAGETGWIEAAGRAGIDYAPIQAATNATEAYLALARQFSGMSRQQRINAAQALGLDEASIRLLSRGEGAVRAVIGAETQMRPVTEEMTESAKEFNDQWQDLMTNMGGFADRVSTEVLPPINKVIAGMNDWIAANRQFLNVKLDSVLKGMADNFDILAVAVTAITAAKLGTIASLAAHIPVIGAGLATIASSLAAITAVGASYLGAKAISEAVGPAFEAQYGVKPQDVPDGIWGLGDLAMQQGQQSGRSVGGAVPWSDIAEPPQMMWGMTPSDMLANPIPSGMAPGSADSPYYGEQKFPRSLEVYLMMDGHVIERKVIDVLDRTTQQSIDDITSSTAG